MCFWWTIANAVAMRNNKKMTKNEKYVKNHITGFNYRFQEPLPQTPSNTLLLSQDAVRNNHNNNANIKPQQ